MRRTIIVTLLALLIPIPAYAQESRSGPAPRGGRGTRNYSPCRWGGSECTPANALDTATRIGERHGPVDHLNTGWGGTSLMIAAWEGHTEIVKVLLEAGAKVKKKGIEGRTALMFASARGHSSIVQALLDAGAKVNAKSNRNLTSLMIGANHGHTKTIKALLAKGAKVNAKDKRGWTALMGATQADHTEIVELLKKAGAKE